MVLKRWNKSLVISFAIIMLVILSGIACAYADHYAVVVITDDRMESSVDEQNADLKQAIGAYVQYLETGGNDVDVFGSVRSKGISAPVYSSGSNTFDWEVGQNGRNDSYFRWSLLQLEEKQYDKIVLITGHLQNKQAKTTAQLSFVSRPETKVILYATTPLPDGESIADVYQRAAGTQIAYSGYDDQNGFKVYGNTVAKENEQFNASTVFFDLLSASSDGKILPGDKGLTIPELLAQQAHLVINGRDLSGLNIIINEQDMYHISTDNSQQGERIWYSPRVVIGSENIYIVRIPDKTTGNIKISGTDAAISLYYDRNPQFGEIIQQASLTQDGLRYNANGSVTIAESTEKAVQELHLSYPELSLQAQVTPFDGSAPYTIYADNDHAIHWQNVPGVEADLLVSLLPSKDSKEILMSQNLHYQPITTFLNNLKPQIEKTAGNDQSLKRDKAGYILSLVGMDDMDEQARRRITDFLTSAVVKVVDENGDQINASINMADYNKISVSDLEVPSVSGSYAWSILVQSDPGYALQWEKTYALPVISVENHVPVCHTELMDTNLSVKVQPGEKAEIDLPAGLFTDEDGDPLTVHFSVLFNGETVKSDSFIETSGTSAQHMIDDLDQFGDWTIELYAEDNEAKKSELLSIAVNVNNGNTAPHIADELKPAEKDVVPLLTMSDFQFRLPEGLFVDDEKNNMTVYVSLTNPGDDVVSDSFPGESGKSAAWKWDLDQFGLWKAEVYAEDEHGLKSDVLSFTIELKDALSTLNGTLRTVPEKPGKGDKIHLELELDWPEEYTGLAIRDWLQECDVIVRGADSTEYEMHLSGDALMFSTDDIQMPETETEFTYSVSVKSRDGADPQKHFTKYNKVNFTLHNSAPVPGARYTETSEEQSQMVFNLEDYIITVPEDLFSDRENDPFTIKIEFEDDHENIVAGPELQGNEQASITLPGFGKWTVKVTATDVEGKASEQIIIHRANVINLKMIVIIAGGSVLLLGIILFVILKHNHDKKKARFQANDYLMFKFNGKAVSKQIKMMADDTRSIPLTTFAFVIDTLLTDIQWSNLKDWAICPTHDEKPVFTKLSNTTETAHEIDLGDGLTVSINE